MKYSKIKIKKEDFSSPDSVAAWTLISILCHATFPAQSGNRFYVFKCFHCDQNNCEVLQEVDEYDFFLMNTIVTTRCLLRAKLVYQDLL